MTTAQLLKAIEPLAAVLHPAASSLQAPEVVSAPDSLDVAPYLRILRWLLEDGEKLRGVGFLYEFDARDFAKVVGQKAVPLAVGAIAAAVKLGPDPEKWNEAVDKAAASTVVAVTNRRIITANTKALGEGGNSLRTSQLTRSGTSEWPLPRGNASTRRLTSSRATRTLAGYSTLTSTAQ